MLKDEIRAFLKYFTASERKKRKKLLEQFVEPDLSVYGIEARIDMDGVEIWFSPDGLIRFVQIIETLVDADKDQNVRVINLKDLNVLTPNSLPIVLELYSGENMKETLVFSGFPHCGMEVLVCDSVVTIGFSLYGISQFIQITHLFENAIKKKKRDHIHLEDWQFLTEESGAVTLVLWQGTYAKHNMFAVGRLRR